MAKVFYTVLGASFICSAAHDETDSSALIIAVRGAGNLALVGMLLEAAANAAATSRALDVGALSATTATGVQYINRPNVHGLTPLHGAAGVGSVEIVKALLKCNANPAAASKADGATPLHFAARNGNTEVVTLLLNAGGAGLTVLKATVDGGGARGIKVSATALDMAQSNGHTEVASVITRFYSKA